MFENYIATKKDFRAIEGGIETVWRPEMAFVFKNKSLLKNVVIISYDSKFLYLWTKIKLPKLKTFACSLINYQAYKIPHKVKLKDEWQLGWRAHLSIKQFEKLLPKKLQKSEFKIPKISGGLSKPFTELQKKKDIKLNPYITYESYLATLVHEFAHIYWNQHKLWWYSNKKENIKYLRIAKQLYERKKEISKIPIYFPAATGITELFATCVEYWASKLFWPNHKKNFDLFTKERLKQLIKTEEKKDLEREDSVLEPSRNPHDFAFIFGKIILTQYPKNWPQILTQPAVFSSVV